MRQLGLRVVSSPLKRPKLGGRARAEPLSGSELTARALRFLGQREHSRLELARKLARYGAAAEEVAALLDRLQASGKLSEARLIEQTLAIRGKRYGRIKLQHELRAKGVSDAQIETHLRPSVEDEITAGTVVWERKFGQLPSSLQEKARQVRFLQNRGFSLDVIYKILSVTE